MALNWAKELSMSVFTKATYSPEDNKLRLYATERLERDLYLRVKDAGFSFAHKQELFVAPRWTVEREDLCLEFVSEITYEESTIYERAQAKIERLEDLSERRFNEANAYLLAANSLMSSISNQPVLSGHHSMRKTMKNNEKAEKAEERSEVLLSSANYWLYRATGVERHCNMKNSSRTRYGRIANLLKELRLVQRALNHAHICHRMWLKLKAESNVEKRNQLVESLAGCRLNTGSSCSWEDVYSPLGRKDITPDEALERAITDAERVIKSEKNARIICHVLNRLSYERYHLGQVDRFRGTLTASIIKKFARENGVHKPECMRVDGEWELSSSVPLPLHLNPNGFEWLCKDDEGWVELMMDAGYSVPLPKPKAPLIMNFKCQSVSVSLFNRYQVLPQIEMTAQEYKNVYCDYRAVKPSECGQFRMKICKDPNAENQWVSNWVSVYITDAKVHKTPISDAITYVAAQEVA